MSRHRFLAFDLGAESGRAVLGTLQGEAISIRELHRFPNNPITTEGRLHWDVPALFREIKMGIKICAVEFSSEIESLAVDTWGVDFGLLDKRGNPLGLPFAYRDLRNVPAMKSFLAKFPKERIYEITGIQFLPFNSLFQLHALTLENPERLADAADLLFMPDLFTYFLSGSITNEATIASTSQLIDPRRNEWSAELVDALSIPPHILHRLTSPGTIVGRILSPIAAETGLMNVPVCATASHDTASAVAAVPARGTNWAFLSSGTWSLMGIETAAPLITPATLRLNFTNEGGLAGRIRFLKNVTGLWLVQQCRKTWSADRPLSYEDMIALAAGAPAFKAFIDPDHPDFLNPPDMPEAIRNFCRRTGQAIPSGPAEIVRCALESLALKYRMVLDELKQISPHPIERIHVIGGGSRNDLLSRFTADATALTVVTGPVEATSIGNILGQALALGIVRSPEEIRAIVATSTDLKTFEPRNAQSWESAYEKYEDILSP